jgi:hypothetical protein
MHREPGPANLNEFFPTKPQVKKPDVEVLGWRGYMWSAIATATAKFSKMTLW